MSLLTNTTALFTTLPSPPPWTSHRTHRTLTVTQARKGLSSSRTRRLEKLGKKEEDEEEKAAAAEAEAWAARQAALYPEGVGGGASEVYSTGPMPEMKWEDTADFWEGSEWEAFGFFIQYQWAFGIGFALIACGIAVTTYNEGATDFKQTPVFKDSIQSQELLEEPDASNSNVFEGNPTEVAPSLE